MNSTVKLAATFRTQYGHDDNQCIVAARAQHKSVIELCVCHNGASGTLRHGHWNASEDEVESNGGVRTEAVVVGTSEMERAAWQRGVSDERNASGDEVEANGAAATPQRGSVRRTLAGTAPMHRRQETSHVGVMVEAYDVGEDNVEDNPIHGPKNVTRISLEEVRTRIAALWWR